MAWLRAFHIVFVVAWFAGLFYLPRLFVYHAMTEDAAGNARFKLMERKLFFAIMTPAAVVAVVLGLTMLLLAWDAYTQSYWLWVKLVLVAGLIGYHVACFRLMQAFARDANQHSHRFYRWFNEVPLVFLVAIVVLAEVKPF
jgi:putative membrane protein